MVDMTVADMTPAELYGLIFLAVFNMIMAGFGIHAARTAENTKERVLYGIGLAGIIGLPLFVGVRLFISLI